MNTILKKYGIFIGIILAVLVFGIKSVIPPYETYFTANSRVSAKKESIKELKKKIEAAKIAKKKAEAKKEEPKETKLIYESPYNSSDISINLNGMLDTVLELAKQSGLKVKTIEFKPIPESDVIIQNHSAELAGSLLSAQFIGNYTQFQTFMRDIYRHQYLMGITNLKITPYEFDKKILIIDMALSLYLKK